jgi:hypothetical protein
MYLNEVSLIQKGYEALSCVFIGETEAQEIARVADSFERTHHSFVCIITSDHQQEIYGRPHT